VVQRTTTQLSSVPFNIDMAITETYPYQVDVTGYLVSGDVVSAVTAVLTLTSTGAIVTDAWYFAVNIVGNIITIPVYGPVLQRGQRYQLATTFTASSGKRLTILSYINIIVQTMPMIQEGTQLDTLPQLLDMALAETYPYIVDVSNYLTGSDTISEISAVLNSGGIVGNLYGSFKYGQNYYRNLFSTNWYSSIAINGNIITITILGNILQLGQTYQLVVTFVANTNKTASFLTYIKVVN
jgi:hypothetical protein